MVPRTASAGDVVTVALPPAGTSPSLARTFVRNQLRNWDLPACEDAATLLVSELVTNALLHARTDMVVGISRANDVVRVEVTDSSTQPPASRHFSLHAGTGRGLQLVESVARSWGVRPATGGKTVWAEIPVGADDEAVVPFDIDGIEAL